MMLKEEPPLKLKNILPGEVLKTEFLVPFDISAQRLSKSIRIPLSTIYEILHGSERITADIALRLAKYFGNSPKFWMDLQIDYDIEEVKNNIAQELDKIPILVKSAGDIWVQK